MPLPGFFRGQVNILKLKRLKLFGINFDAVSDSATQFFHLANRGDSVQSNLGFIRRNVVEQLD